jgi:hypothetical protein
MDHRLNERVSEGIIYLCQQKEQKPINNAAAQQPLHEKSCIAAAASPCTEPYCQRLPPLQQNETRKASGHIIIHFVYLFMIRRYRQELAA